MVSVMSTFGGPTVTEILAAVGLVPATEVNIKGATIGKLTDGRNYIVQYGTRYDTLGVRQDVKAEDDRRPYHDADVYVYCLTSHPKTTRSNRKFVVMGGAYTAGQVAEKCMTRSLRYDEKSDRWYVSWTET